MNNRTPPSRSRTRGGLAALASVVGLSAGCGADRALARDDGTGGTTSLGTGGTTGDALDAAATGGWGGASSTGSGGAFGGSAGGAGMVGGGGTGGAGRAVIDAAPESGPPPNGREAGRDGALSAEGGARDAGIGGPSLCAGGRFAICEDFEATAVGAVPTRFTRTGATALVQVAADQAARGAHSLKLGAAATGARRIALSAVQLGPLATSHWGRLFYRVQTPQPIPANGVIHSTLVAGTGTSSRGNPVESRLVDTVEDTRGMHQFLYNVQETQSGGPEFGRGSAYNYRYDGQWHCAEWRVDSPSQSYHFYLDGTEVTSIGFDGTFADSEIPVTFNSLAFGWNNYQSAAVGGNAGFVAWIDEIALDANRIGCEN